jgi:hypothetical protein
MNVAAVRPSCVADPLAKPTRRYQIQACGQGAHRPGDSESDPDDLIIEGVDKEGGGVLYTPTRCAAASVR